MDGEIVQERKRRVYKRIAPQKLVRKSLFYRLSIVLLGACCHEARPITNYLFYRSRNSEACLLRTAHCVGCVFPWRTSRVIHRYALSFFFGWTEAAVADWPTCHKLKKFKNTKKKLGQSSISAAVLFCFFPLSLFNGHLAELTWRPCTTSSYCTYKRIYLIFFLRKQESYCTALSL